MSAQQLAQDLRKLQHLFQAPWDMGDEDNALAHCCQAFELAKVLPPGGGAAQMQPLCKELLTVAKSVCALEPQLWQRLGATRDTNVTGLKRILSQASAGAYLAAICLYTGLCTSSAAVKEDLLFHLGKATALGFRAAMGAAERLAAALPGMADRDRAATSATLRGRVPFLLGLLVRPAALIAQTAAGAPAARSLQKLRRGAWSPQALLEAMLLGARAATAMLSSGPPGGNWSLHLATVQLSLSMAAELTKPGGQRLVAPADSRQQRVLNAPLLLALEQLAAGLAQGGSGGWNRAAVESPMWQLAWQHALKALPLVLHCPETEHFTSEESATLSRTAQQAVAAFTAAAAALPAGAPLPPWAGHAAGAVELGTAACDALFRASMPTELGLSGDMEVGSGMVRALLLAETQLPAVLHLLRLLLCCAAGASGAGVDCQAAQRLLQATCKLVHHMHGLQLNDMVTLASALVVVVPADQPASSAEQALAVLASLSEVSLRCLVDWPILEAAVTGLLRAARVAGGVGQYADSQQLMAVVEKTAGFCMTAAFNMAAVRHVNPSAPSLAPARPALLSLAHTACKVVQRVAACPQLRRKLWEEGQVERRFWVCGAVASALGMVGQLSKFEAHRDGEADRQLQSCALAAFAALRASAAAAAAAGDEYAAGRTLEEEAGGCIFAHLDNSLVQTMCILLPQPAIVQLLVGEGAVAELAAAAVRMLGRESIEESAAEILCTFCRSIYGLALSIAAQPGFAELASTPAEGGFAVVQSQQHGEIMHAVEQNVMEALEEGRLRQLGAAGAEVRAAGLAGMLPALRRQKLLMARLAAEQLEEQPAVPPPGSEEAAELAVERAWALGARPGCSSLACTNLAGASEASLKARRCSRCRVVRFCCDACNKDEWRRHKRACGMLAAARASAQEQQ